VNAVMNLRVP